MSIEFWINKWHNAEIGFHLDHAHSLLVRYWPELGTVRGSRVFVPLCGKTLDMDFLRQHGCQVTGIELSPIAIRQYLEEHALRAVPSVVDGMPVHDAPGLRLIEGDFFQLGTRAVGTIDAVYDRAALIAMPPAMQTRYAEHLLTLTPETAPILLITLDYNPAEMTGPPFATPPEEVRRLFEGRYHCEALEWIDALADNPALQSRGLTGLTETAWHLRPR
jgi:thiopurine S-methyltransferase